MMNKELATGTPSYQGRKRELASPEFDIDSKKNKVLPISPSAEPLPAYHTDIDTDQAMASNTASSSDSTSHIIIPQSEMEKLSNMLKETFQGQILGFVKDIVEGVLDGIQDQISKVETRNQELMDENQELRERVDLLERKVDQAEQYSRRNCLRISGVKENRFESTDDIVLKMATDIGSEIQLSDIDRSHRVGNPNNMGTRTRDIIVKFATYRSRQNLYKLRNKLKDTGHEGEFVNEDLTRFRSGVLFEARKLVKVKFVQGAWASDGNILVKDNSDDVHRISSLSDLFRFGYLLMNPNLPAMPGQNRGRLYRPRGALHPGGRGYAGAAANMDHSGTFD